VAAVVAAAVVEVVVEEAPPARRDRGLWPVVVLVEVPVAAPLPGVQRLRAVDWLLAALRACGSLR
jgi:hypothetical protein